MKHILTIPTLAILAISFISSPVLAQLPAGQPKIVDDALRSEIHLVWSTSQSIVVPYSDIDKWEAKAHASGMISVVRNKMDRGETGYFTSRALGKAAAEFGDAVVLRQAGNDTTSLAYKAWKKTKSSPEMRQETSEQFISALIHSAMNGAKTAAPTNSVSADEFRKVANKVSELETKVTKLEAKLLEVAHASATAANGKAKKDDRNAAIDFLASLK